MGRKKEKPITVLPPCSIKRGRPSTRQRICDALVANFGLVSNAARDLNISSAGLRRMIAKDPVLQLAIIDGNEERKDLAISVIDKALLAGDKKIAMEVVKLTAQDRGFVSGDGINITNNVMPAIIVDDI